MNIIMERIRLTSFVFCTFFLRCFFGFSVVAGATAGASSETTCDSVEAVSAPVY
jgi:hypothetical protein